MKAESCRPQKSFCVYCYDLFTYYGKVRVFIAGMNIFTNTNLLFLLELSITMHFIVLDSSGLLLITKGGKKRGISAKNKLFSIKFIVSYDKGLRALYIK